MIPSSEFVPLSGLTPQQQAWFYAEYHSARKDEVVGVLLALFLGGFGIHHFYLHRNGLGIVYLLLSWTGIPMILGWIECFFMPGRVREYNSMQAAFIAARIAGTPLPETPYPAYSASIPTAPATTRTDADTLCPACSMTLSNSASFCPRCGAAIVH